MKEGRKVTAGPGEKRKPPRGMTAVGIFLLFGAGMAALAGMLLLFPGTKLDWMWELNPGALRELSLMGRKAGFLFLGLSGVLAGAGVGWLRRRKWGWWLAVGIIGVQIVGDVVNVMRGEVWKGAVGAVIAGALLIYLMSGRVRGEFGERRMAKD